MPKPKNQRDEFAEHYVAGVFADAGWCIYFPHRDQGFDFVVTKKTARGMVLRPVQVKGKYPEATTVIRRNYGYRGMLTATHPSMVLAIPLFTAIKKLPHPAYIAYMPFGKIAPGEDSELTCYPAQLVEGNIVPKDTFRQYFDDEGLNALGSEDWK
jgi:hypothetical protein